MELLRDSRTAFNKQEVIMADGGITTFLIISSVLSAAAAGVSYVSAVDANKRAAKAADDRDRQLQAQYDAQAAGESKKQQSQQRKMSYERHLKNEQVQASMASAGLVTTTGSAAALQSSVDSSYRVAQLESAAQSTTNQKILYTNLQGGMAETNTAYQSAITNPLLDSLTTGLQVGSAMMSIGSGLTQMGAFAGAPATVGAAPIGTTGDLLNQQALGPGTQAFYGQYA